MQKLMLIEQAYAANARVITTIDAMLDVLMGI
jgi:flagellar hook-associated protein FlgK